MVKLRKSWSPGSLSDTRSYPKVRVVMVAHALLTFRFDPSTPDPGELDIILLI